MNPLKITVIVTIIVLSILQIVFLSTNFYGNCSQTGEKVCKICIDEQGNQEICSCEYEEECIHNPTSFILPVIAFLLAIINFAIPFE